MKTEKHKKHIRGNAVNEVLIGAAIIIFVLFPIFSAIIERYIIIIKAQEIKDSVDITNIATYMAIDTENLGKNLVIHNELEVEAIYSKFLAINLNLEEDLSPKDNSVADGKVRIESIAIYPGGQASICPLGTEIIRPTVHSVVIVPVKPSLYRQVILALLGKCNIELKVHVDSDIPVNN